MFFFRTNIQPEECRRTDHHWTMYTFPKGQNCSYCGKFLKGLFYQGYRCVRCDAGVHRDCISVLPKCGLVHPPELPPRPPLLPIPTQSQIPSSSSIHQISTDLFTIPAIPTSPGTLEHSQSFPGGSRSPRRLKIPQSPSSPPLPQNNLNSPSTLNGMTSLRPSLQPSHHYVNLNNLESYPWYGGEMDRDTATGVLLDTAQHNGTFLVRVRPATQQASVSSDAATYAVSLRWSDQVKHMKILVTSDGKLFYLSESRYFKSVVELINWYQHNSLAECFSG